MLPEFGPWGPHPLGGELELTLHLSSGPVDKFVSCISNVWSVDNMDVKNLGPDCLSFLC